MNYELGIRNKLKFAFFGTDEFSVIVLEELQKAGYVPQLLITAPDRPKGRGLKLTPPPVKQRIMNNELGIKKRVNILQPEKLDRVFVGQVSNVKCQMFVVASYGKILPKDIFALPECGTLNVHPSLLPLFRGPSPIQSQILNNVSEAGATIILMDEKMDHGPIVGIMKYESRIKNTKYKELEEKLAHRGGKLLAETIPRWVAGKITPREQDHKKATYTKMIKKEDGLLDLNDDPEDNYRKFLAYTQWPGIYFFDKNERRIKIIDADFSDGKFNIKKIIPEGKQEIVYKDWLRNQ